LIVPRKNAAANTHPHAKPNRGALLSSCFLLAIVVDYWIGYLISLKQSRARSGLILFDRYFHDVLVDPRRYRYGGPPWFARWMARLIPSPDLVVILDADERVIGERKAELPAEEISRQRWKYKELKFPDAERIVVNTDKDRELTLDEVGAAIVQSLALRFQNRHPEWLAVKKSQ
jgi:thymidylate kinase